MTKQKFYKSFNWQLAHNEILVLGPSSILMGILNVTPDSFSDGGANLAIDYALKSTQRMLKAGAHIIDVGGESTRPGAKSVTAKEEQNRVLPIINAIAKKYDCLISIDTYRASTAEKAINAGAHIVNDVWGFQKDPKIAKVVKQYRAGCVLMHTGRERIKDDDPIKDHFKFLNQSLKIAKQAGLSDKQIILDPGFGFAKDVAENIKLLARMDELFKLGQPILTGTSRKRFLGAITGNAVARRDIATAATSVVARMNGSSIFRVHDVAKNADALKVADAVVNARFKL